MGREIHQMWFQGRSEMPSQYAEKSNTWIEKNPNWNYRFWDEISVTELIKSEYPDYFDSWDSLDKIIKKCDAARCFILHSLGGVYADLDTVCHKPIDELMSDFDLHDFDIVFSEEAQDVNEHFHWKANLRKLVYEEYGGERFVGNAILISKKGVGFWLDFLEASFLISERTVLESFSTWHLSKYLNQNRSNHLIKILPFSVMLSPVFKENKTYFTHSYDATWFNSDSDRPWEG